MRKKWGFKKLYIKTKNLKLMPNSLLSIQKKKKKNSWEQTKYKSFIYIDTHSYPIRIETLYTWR